MNKNTQIGQSDLADLTKFIEKVTKHDERAVLQIFKIVEIWKNNEIEKQNKNFYKS
jgi:hypothetical protein